ncbi:DNA polymerase elongation subunit (family b) [Halogeometricum pallidum JCM 14848]|uniref:DNA polymerase n=1 Tax=Halogeometricum pallidum JCM 14848 TaxID=1227487 RepID=M0CVR5_HALPD|nr:DNA polymerase elongation subunit [Halogeometricum pallidum]ELZ27315.1 DNA polymerase elongation subunit (family b) [Halogeometricum pallidum JCM 14848]
MKQAGLTDGDWGGGGDADGARPQAEAEHVAGNGSQHVSDVVDAEEIRFPDADGTVELAVTQVDYTVEGSGNHEYPVVHVFGRTRENETEHIRVLGLEPYFYAPTDTLDDDLLDKSVITRTEAGYESIRGEDLTKICTRTPRDVGQIRDEFDHYEADILFPNRLLIDKDIQSGICVPARRLDDEDGTVQVPHDEVVPIDVEADLRVNTFDIEVNDRAGFPEEGEEPIICLTSHDSYRDEYIAWLYNAPEAGDGVEAPTDLGDYQPLDDATEVEIRAFDREGEMLDAFVRYIEETDPDVLTGWNFEDFDMPYFLDRLDVVNPTSDYDLDPDRLSRIGEVWRSGWGGPDVKGRVVFDLLYAYKRTQFSELESYRLDAVGELELDVGKERYTGSIGDLWEEDPKRLLEYNVRDVELCVEIDRKQDVVAFWDEVRTFVGCKLEDATTPGDTVDIYVLHKVHGEFALPSKGRQDAEEYEGGAVFDPITGVKENVTVLDLKSLYPMCMVTINASPETKVDPETYEGETFHAPNGTHFRKEPDGIIREMVDELLEEREEKKRLRNENDPGSAAYEQFDRQQSAVKVIMNSLYGVLGWDRFRLYDKEMGAAVTATGREVIEFTQRTADEMDYSVAYGDTDSVMLELGPDVSKEDAIEQSFDIEERINDAYDEFARDQLGVDLDGGEEHRFQIEFEKLYRRFFQAGKKKRYAGHIIWKEGKDVDDIDITGFEYKRSDIAAVTKEVQKEVIEMIVYGESNDTIKEYVHEVISDFQEGNLPLDEVGIPGGLGKRLDAYDTRTAQVRGSLYANAFLGTNFGRGSKPKRIYLAKVHPSWFRRMEDEREFDPQRDDLYGQFKRDPDVICFEYEDQVPEEFEVAWDTMLEKTLEGPIARIIEALGMSWDEVKSGQQQTGLGSFM